MPSKATGTIITAIVVIAVVVGVVFFLGKKKANASGAGATSGAGGGGGSSFGSISNPITSVKAAAADLFSKAIPSLGSIPTSGSGLPPPACPRGAICEPARPVSHAPPPPPVMNTVEEMEQYTARGAGSF